jgi:hypothetical protein
MFGEVAAGTADLRVDFSKCEFYIQLAVRHHAHEPTKAGRNRAREISSFLK